jgi:hypothetical protein
METVSKNGMQMAYGNGMRWGKKGEKLLYLETALED